LHLTIEIRRALLAEKAWRSREPRGTFQKNGWVTPRASRYRLASPDAGRQPAAAVPAATADAGSTLRTSMRSSVKKTFSKVFSGIRPIKSGVNSYYFYSRQKLSAAV
jgi:hypothetical protein